MSGFERELTTARDIALEAAALVHGYHGRDIAVDVKAGDEPVTEADRAASDLIVRRLRDAFPSDAVLSEEVPDDRSRLGRSRVWLVDPIDGTRDFIRGDIGFAVMIGLCVEAAPHVGVVVQPMTGKIYTGIVGQGAWLERPDEPRRSLLTSELDRPPGIRLVASKSHRTDRVDAVKDALQISDEMNIGSVGLKIGLVAEGARDLYIYTGARTKIWDTCGPEAILKAAGGRLTDLDGRPLAYDREELKNRRGLIASNGPLHELVVETLAPVVAGKAD